MNQGAWKDMEADWADALREGKQVEVFIDIDYGDCARPTGFDVTYLIDGRTRNKYFSQ